MLVAIVLANGRDLRFGFADNSLYLAQLEHGPGRSPESESTSEVKLRTPDVDFD